MTATTPFRTADASSTTPRAAMRRPSAARQLLRHYAEMVLVMVLGMVVLGVPVDTALRVAASGSGESPARMLLGMGISMTVPMVAWMTFRGHSPRASAEMAATMVVPTLAAIAVHASGLVDDINVVVVTEHAVMLVAMLAAMLARPSEYTHTAAAG